MFKTKKDWAIAMANGREFGPAFIILLAFKNVVIQPTKKSGRKICMLAPGSKKSTKKQNATPENITPSSGSPNMERGNNRPLYAPIRL